MKNVFKKFLVLSAVISLAFTGCNDISDFGNSNEENATVHAAGKAELSLSVNQNSARTIMPTNISEADVTQIELTAKKIDSDGKETDDYYFQLEDNSKATMVQWVSADGKTAIENMVDSSVTIDWGTYNFTLTLYTGDAGAGSLRLTQEATLENQTITAETTSLEFEAKYVEKGDLSLTIQFDSDFDIDKRIGAVKAGLFTMASKGKDVVTGYDYEELSIIENAASYIEYDVPNGTYYVKFLIYSPVTVDEESGESKSGELLNTISEIVKIHGYKTEKTINIANEDLNALYSVSYNLNNEKVAWKEDVEDGLTTKRNIYTGITLPVKDDIKCSGWKLLGWCEKDSVGNPIDADGDGETDIITTISTGIDTAKDYTLYAVWEKEEANVEFDISIKVGEKNEISAEYETDDSIISFTVTPPDAEATYTYTWTVDDDEQDPITDPTFEIDASNWATGVYDISFIAKEVKDDKETYYSYTAQIEWTKKFKVEFNISNAPAGTGPIEPLYVAENAETKTITAPTDVTPTFGWDTDSEFKEEFDFTKPITSSITLYGCWDLNGAIYVSENGTDPIDGAALNRGTLARPLASIAAAVNLMTDDDTEYTIYVDGKVTGVQEIKKSSELSNGGHAFSITISGKTGNTDCLDGNNEGRTLTVSTNVPVTIENLEITGGLLTSTGSYGGGLYVASGADVTLAGYTKITDNTATCGGGVAVDGILIMTENSTISGNTATALYGGGAHVGSSGVLDMQTGSIYGNNISGTPDAGAEKQGYGVYVSGSSGKLKMGGSAIVGSSEDTVPNDVYLSSGTKISITSQLMGGVTTATITPAHYGTTTQWLEVEEGCTAELATEYSSFAVTPSGTTNYRITETGYLQQLADIDDVVSRINEMTKSDTIYVSGYLEDNSDFTIDGTTQSGIAHISSALQTLYGTQPEIKVTLDLSGVTGLSEVPDKAFLGCTALVSISLPEGLTSIGESAFSGCASLSEVTLPATLESIASDAFSETALSTVNYRGTDDQRNSLTIDDATIADITWTYIDGN